MQNYKEYRKKQTQLLRPYVDGEDMSGVSISDADIEKGSPQKGDMIAVNRNDETDKWLVAEKFFKDNYELANQRRTTATIGRAYGHCKQRPIVANVVGNSAYTKLGETNRKRNTNR